MKLKYFLLLAIIIRIFFFVSAGFTHSLDKFFLPVTPGQDFFQIPNAVYSFLHGGAYTDCCGVNQNVYHPLFTLLIGAPLQLLKPWTAYYLWLLIHLLTDLFIIWFLFAKFRKNRLLPLAITIYLVSSFGFYEILNNQFHFLLNLFTFLLLYELYKKGDSVKAGLLFFLGLLVKPIGLLWLIPLIIKRYFKTAIIGVGIFLAFTLPFWLLPQSKYYFDNLIKNITASYSDWNIFHVASLFGFQVKNILVIKLLLFLLLILLSFSKKLKIFEALLLWTAFVLFTYHNSFPYHHSIIAIFIASAILFARMGTRLFEKITLLMLTLPAPLFLGRFTTFANPLEKKAVIFLFWTYLGEILLVIAILGRVFRKNEKK